MKFEFNTQKLAAAIKIICEDIKREHEDENYHRFIRIMAELDWPAFLEYDPWLHERVIEYYEEDRIEELINALYDNFDTAYLKEFVNRCKLSKVIKTERIPIIEEAVFLLHIERYYGAVATLITQIAGIVADIEEFMKDNDMEYDERNEKLIRKRYKISATNEKGRLLNTLLEGQRINDEQGEYNYLIGYFRSKVFSSGLDGDEIYKHANRNMICHGEQTSFGSKEQALKVVLCIDALVWVAESIYEYSVDQLENVQIYS